jgi:signal transduction histidine kinase
VHRKRRNRGSDYIGPLTHELRQEVSAVLHQVELLKTPSLDELTRRRSLGAIEDNAENLMAFVDDLVCLGRVSVETSGELPTGRSR